MQSTLTFDYYSLIEIGQTQSVVVTPENSPCQQGNQAASVENADVQKQHIGTSCSRVESRDFNVTKQLHQRSIMDTEVNNGHLVRSNTVGRAEDGKLKPNLEWPYTRVVVLIGLIYHELTLM